MKELIEFKRLNNDVSSLETLVELHRSVYNNSFFKNKLIYFDTNFYNLLKKFVKDSHHLFYVIEVNSTIVGFSHLRLIDDFLFLNTISVNNNYARRGLGKKLLSYSIQEFSKINLNVGVLKLDVFGSNYRAFNWYKDLGFIVEKNTTWYQFKKVLFKEKLNFSIQYCYNGFLSLFFNEIKIATIINNNLILHNSNYIFYIDINQFKCVITNDESFKTNIFFKNTPLIFEPVDVSFRMSIELKKCIKYI